MESEIVPASAQVEELLSLNAMSRRVDCYYGKLADLVRAGVVAADFRASGTLLFRSGRVAAIKQIMAAQRSGTDRVAAAIRASSK
jgi:hypothetical protein